MSLIACMGKAQIRALYKKMLLSQQALDRDRTQSDNDLKALSAQIKTLEQDEAKYMKQAQDIIAAINTIRARKTELEDAGRKCWENATKNLRSSHEFHRRTCR